MIRRALFGLIVLWSVVLLSAPQAHGALSANTVWEVRTTGSDNSGSGFVSGASGTDYSQQDAAQFSGTDLVVDATTNTKITSASHNFVAADVGNIIQITAGSGWTTGFYQIASVASNAATLDRSPAATSTTGGTWAEGGALSSPGKAAADPLNVTVPGSYADHIVGKIISRLDIPPATAFVAAVPAAPSDVSMCRVYGYLETLDNQPAANVTISFTLATKDPVKSERLITGRTITAKTDSQGRLADASGNPYIDLQRNDHLAPAGSKYLVNCQPLGLQNKEITLTGDTFDLSSIIP